MSVMRLATALLAAAAAALVLLAGRAAAQAGSPTTDKAALMAFKADGNSANAAMSGWTDDSEPCAEGSWDSRIYGWKGVMCDMVAPEGRVTVVYLPESGLVGDIVHLAPLKELRLMSVSGNPAVTGDLSSLGSLTELRHLRLGETGITGQLGRGLIWIRNPWGLR